jgi:hypothetical protein
MLLVFLAAAPRADRADPWVRTNARGEVLARGETPFARLGEEDVVVVLAAAHVRLVALDMPPMSRERLERAVRLALDDAVASDADDTAIASIEQGAGKVVAAIASRALVDAIAHDTRRAVRLVPESALVPAVDGWTWCRSGAGGGFVRCSDGGAFAIGERVDNALPDELVVALAHARRNGHPPASIHCAFACDAVARARWSQAGGVSFVPAAPWRWDEASVSAIANAPDFARATVADDGKAKATWRAFRPALALAALALAVHLGGLLATRATLALENARVSRALVAEARARQLPDAGTSSSAGAAIAREHAQRMHAAGKPAPADAIPLLARAAPALASLAPGTLRSARYAGDAWTLDLARIDRDHLSQLSRALAASGLDALAAPASGGMRLRVALAPTAP